MATWADAKAFFHSNFKLEELSDELLKIVFGLDGLRSQVVLVGVTTANTGDGDEEWLDLSSPFASVNDVDPMVALKFLEGRVCGGLGLVGDFLVLTHSLPLVNADPNEIIAPLRVLAVLADHLEQELTGGDKF